MDSIKNTIVEQQRVDKGIAEDERKAAEKASRGKQEKDLEGKFSGLKQTAEKVLAPVKSVWEKIINFITTVLLGKVAIKLFSWFADKENKKKVEAIGRFLKDFWPTLLAAYLMFGNALGRFVTGIIGKIVIWTVKIVAKVIPALIKAVAKMKLGKWGKAGLIVGGVLAAGYGAHKMMSGGEEKQSMEDGGAIQGPSHQQGGVPIEAEGGEFVMSRGAVNKWGLDTLENMNAMGGGTNLPELGGGGGGTNSLTEQAKVKTFGSAIGDFFSGDDGRSRRMTDLEKSQRMEEGGLVAKDFYSWQRQAFNPSPKRGSDPMAGTAEARKRLKEIWMEGRSGNVTIENYRQYVELGGNARKSEYYKKILERNKKREFNAKFAKTLTKSELDDVNKERALGGEKPLNLAPTTTKTTEVKPPVKNNVVKNYIAEKENSDVQNNANTDPVPGGEGTGIPEFDAEKYISQQKLKTLGIT